MVTCTGDQEIGVVPGRLLDNLGELACMLCTRIRVGAMFGLLKKPLSICQSGLRNLIAASQTVIATIRLCPW